MDRTEKKNRQMMHFEVGDFNTNLSTIVRIMRHKISKESNWTSHQQKGSSQNV